MIRIFKGVSPNILMTRGVAAHEVIATAIAVGESPTFRNSIYAHQSVKDTLRVAQNGKCAFCESKYEHIAYGDVEHFRPKAGFKQSVADELEHPGYYWLTYAWDNLFLSCTLCNQQFKANLFPLRDPRHRCRHPDHQLTRESPLLIHPAFEDPELFITFVGETAKPKRGGGAQKGRTTIDSLGLNRDPLRSKRYEAFERLKAMVEARELLLIQNQVSVNSPAVEKLETLIQAALLPSAEYSSMAKAFIQAHTTPVS